MQRIANVSLKEQSKEVIKDLQAAVRLAQDEAERSKADRTAAETSGAQVS